MDAHARQHMEGQNSVLFAAEGQTGSGSFAPTLLMMLGLVGAMYFLFIRPNKRRRQQIEQMQSSIGPGDEVLTIGGLYGIVTEIDDDRIVLEVSPGVTNTYSRSAISQVVSAAPDAEEIDVDEEPAVEASAAPEATGVDVTKPEVTTKKIIDSD
jgi:preprotein translocase subunit YajC